MQQLLHDPFVLLIPVALLIATILAGLLLRKLLFGLLRRWSRSANNKLDVLIIDTLRGPILLWALILGLHLGTQNSEIPPRYLHYIPKILAALWGLSLTIVISYLARNIVRLYGNSAKGVRSVTSLSEKLVQFSILIVGLLWVVKVVFDVSLTPILTTLGVGGLAVALALQDTLSNLFAGFYVSVSGLIRIGDYVRLSTGEEGYVSDINWRCTTMLTRVNNLIVIPNSKLGQTIYTNYFLPDGRMVTSVLVGVGPESDIDRVEKVLLEEAVVCAKEVASVLESPPPTVRFSPGLWNGALFFQVLFSVSQFSDQPLARSEIRKRMFRRLTHEGIPVQFPAPSVPVANDSSGQ
jgi:small-conductance mechanosensitive channel